MSRIKVNNVWCETKGKRNQNSKAFKLFLETIKSSQLMLNTCLYASLPFLPSNAAQRAMRGKTFMIVQRTKAAPPWTCTPVEGYSKAWKCRKSFHCKPRHGDWNNCIFIWFRVITLKAYEVETCSKQQFTIFNFNQILFTEMFAFNFRLLFKTWQIL